MRHNGLAKLSLSFLNNNGGQVQQSCFFWSHGYARIVETVELSLHNALNFYHHYIRKSKGVRPPNVNPNLNHNLVS